MVRTLTQEQLLTVGEIAERAKSLDLKARENNYSVSFDFSFGILGSSVCLSLYSCEKAGCQEQVFAFSALDIFGNNRMDALEQAFKEIEESIIMSPIDKEIAMHEAAIKELKAKKNA